jgi:hypothetical protein
MLLQRPRPLHQTDHSLAVWAVMAQAVLTSAALENVEYQIISMERSIPIAVVAAQGHVRTDLRQPQLHLSTAEGKADMHLRLLLTNQEQTVWITVVVAEVEELQLARV